MKKHVITLVFALWASASIAPANNEAEPMVLAEVFIDGALPSSAIRIGELSTSSIGKEKDILGVKVFYGKLFTIKPTANLDGSYQAQLTYITSDEPVLDAKSGVISQSSVKKVFVVSVNDKERKVDIGGGRFIKVKLYLISATGIRI